MKQPVKKAQRGFIPQVRSRHPSHNVLRGILERQPFRSVIRFGSLTEANDSIDKGGNRIEVNSTESIKNSSSKLRMKKCFIDGGAKTAEYITGDKGLDAISKFSRDLYPIVAKSHFGSRGKGNTLLKNEKELADFSKNIKHPLSNYIFEKYYNYNKEYRLHITEDGCFYSCRKMLKNEAKGTPNAWQRHDDNCVWILEQNPNFERPTNWNTIVEHCVKALKSCGLDIGACDLRVQSNMDEKGGKRDNPDFIVVEINSAPSFGDITAEKYKEELPKLLKRKYNQIKG